jgi:adenosylcobinamide-phosphate synthase
VSLAAAAGLVVAALAVDAVLGDPPALWRRLPHPVVLFGRLIAALDACLNDARRSDGARRALGVLALVVLVAVAFLAGLAIEAVLGLLPAAAGFAVTAALAAVLIAQKSLDEHVARVRDALATGDLSAAREAVSHIVGRDPAALDDSGVARAAIETAAENFADGVVAPAFWLAVGGLPGLLAYKAVNTADSMIGHLSDRHRAFGWASARFDDLVNFVPARLSGVLTALAAPAAGGRIGTALAVMIRDARGHASPNAGWPEAAMAGALDVALLGPTVYDGETDDKPWLNFEGRHALAAADVTRSLRVFRLACGLHALAYGVVAAVALALSA